MTIISAEITVYIPWALSLKDKRQVKRSIIDKVKKFNVSIAEVGTQDSHQKLTLGLAAVSAHFTHAKEMMDTIIRYIDSNTEAEIANIEIWES